MKQTIEVEFTPSLSSIPDLLVDIATVLQASVALSPPALSEASSDPAASLELARLSDLLEQRNAEVLAERQAVETLRSELTAVRDQPRVEVEYREGQPDMQCLWLTGLLHCKRECSQINRAAYPPLTVYMPREAYAKEKARGTAAHYLCSYCHKFGRQGGATRHAGAFLPGELPNVGEGVVILPHGEYKHYTRGTVKEIDSAHRRACVKPKNHNTTEWMETSLLRKLPRPSAVAADSSLIGA